MFHYLFPVLLHTSNILVIVNVRGLQMWSALYIVSYLGMRGNHC